MSLDDGRQPGRAFPRLRSLLVVDGHDAVGDGLATADALVLVSPRTGMDATVTPAWTERPPLVLVLASLGDEAWLEEGLGALMRLRPDGVVLADTRSGRCLQQLGARLAVHEAECGLPDGGTPIVALVSSAAGLLGLPDLRGASRRLVGLAWDETRLRADLGADPEGSGAPEAGDPVAVARASVLIAARALGVQPIDTASSTTDAAMLARQCDTGRRMGFTGKFAASPEQIAVINTGFGA